MFTFISFCFIPINFFLFLRNQMWIFLVNTARACDVYFLGNGRFNRFILKQVREQIFQTFLWMKFLVLAREEKKNSAVDGFPRWSLCKWHFLPRNYNERAISSSNLSVDVTEVSMMIMSWNRREFYADGLAVADRVRLLFYSIFVIADDAVRLLFLLPFNAFAIYTASKNSPVGLKRRSCHVIRSKSISKFTFLTTFAFSIIHDDSTQTQYLTG